MAMTSAMDYVSYERVNFNFDYKQFRHPKWITERHFIYHLCQDDRGYLMCVRDNEGEPIRSPRYEIVRDIVTVVFLQFVKIRRVIFNFTESTA